MNALGALCRKVARRRAEGDDSPVVIEPETVVDLLGPPPVPETRVGDRTGRPGVAVALGVTADGGDVIFVEASRMPGRGRLTLTGSLGDDMRESGQTAVSWLRAHAAEYGVDPGFHRDTDIHLHAQAALPSKGRHVGGAGDGGRPGVAVHGASRAPRPGHDRRDHAVGARGPGGRHQAEGAGGAAAPVLQIGEILQNLDARRPDRTDERHEGRLEEAGILALVSPAGRSCGRAARELQDAQLRLHLPF